MLILSRKVGEKIVIGDGITVVVSQVAGNRVTLGLEAPPEVRILRGELNPFAEPSMAAVEKQTGKSRSKQCDRGFRVEKVVRPR